MWNKPSASTVFEKEETVSIERFFEAFERRFDARNPGETGENVAAKFRRNRPRDLKQFAATLSGVTRAEHDTLHTIVGVLASLQTRGVLLSNFVIPSK